jgi:replicative DNA helicase
MRDLSKRIESANPTEEELQDLLLWVAERTKPKPKESAPLVSLGETWEEALKLKGDGEGIGGVSTGFRCIDDITGGLRPGQLIIIFGDTGHGKSMLTQNITYNIAKRGEPVLFIGLEMTNAENTERLQGMGATADLPVLYPANIDLDVKGIEPMIKSGVENGIVLAVIDHLHMFEGLTGENEAQFLTATCREAKMLAIKYNIPVILVSHISNRPEGEEKNIPQLRHLKGSSSIKQLADSALAVHNESMVSDLPDDGMPELLIKQRKSRRGRQTTLAKLRIMPNARLSDMNSMIYSPLG